MNKNLLNEAVVILETFRLMVDVPAFSDSEKASLREEKAASRTRFEGHVAVANSLNESRTPRKFAAARRAAIKEAIVLERLTIMEAASSLSVNEMANQLAGMVKSVAPIAQVSESVVNEVQQKAEAAHAMVMELEDLEGAGMSGEFRKKLGEFKTLFGDVATVVKGLVAVSDELFSGALAEIINPVLSWVVKRKQKTTSLLETFEAYDAEVNRATGGGAETPMKQGYLSKLFSRSKPTAGASNTADKFQKAFESIVRSKAPGFAKLATRLGGDLIMKPIRAVLSAFKAFDNSVASSLDLDMILNMSKQSWGSALMGFLGTGLQGRGMGVGMAGGGTAGRA